MLNKIREREGRRDGDTWAHLPSD